MVVPFLIRLSLIYFYAKATMVWELETLPSVFGKDVILRCTLPQTCCKNMQSRRWLGGNDLHLLTMNGFSIDPAKYSEKFIKENKTLILTIHAFDIEDINVPYECIYGSSTFVKMLNLTEDKFEYHPSGPYTEYTTINNTDALSVSISTGRVYPRPKCSAAMNGEDNSLHMTKTTIMQGLFYVVTITVTIVSTLGSCPSLLNITCKIGTHSYIYEKNVTCNRVETDNYTSKESTGMNASVILTGLIITGVVIVTCIAVCAGFTIARSKYHPVILHTEHHEISVLDSQDISKTGKRVNI